jgi:hypothetical protein
MQYLGQTVYTFCTFQLLNFSCSSFLQNVGYLSTFQLYAPFMNFFHFLGSYELVRAHKSQKSFLQVYRCIARGTTYSLGPLSNSHTSSSWPAIFDSARAFHSSSPALPPRPSSSQGSRERHESIQWEHGATEVARSSTNLALLRPSCFALTVRFSCRHASGGAYRESWRGPVYGPIEKFHVSVITWRCELYGHPSYYSRHILNLSLIYYCISPPKE